MEIRSSDGGKTLIKPGSQVVFGRGLGFEIDDKTVSRRHVSFQLNHWEEEKTRACFKVTGINPIWVHSSKTGKVSTFRNSESGEMEIGDMFCVSAKNPIWFTLRKIEFEDEKGNNMKSELAESSNFRCEIKDGDFLEPESVDVSQIDPVKEFGFLVIGKEFESYPKKMILDIKKWNWFIEESRSRVDMDIDDDDEELEEKRKKRKRKKHGEDDDDEWSGESEEEEEKEQFTKAKKVEKTKYLTRSKDGHKPSKDKGKKNTLSNVKNRDDDDEDDETLGGFIVDNDELEQEEELDDDDDEEEEEFEEDELDD
ncbi:hypothetical protein M9H77_15300 [Catharanthus roseus]|uniref:Uncharacterized protein n=1 Tax=Catharanthus roseus TaxID=4058 RepID=A0ACC0AZR3_CATRO|nr:hypothetical protein M9H77_15300 [Catharanthus roseus]